MRLETRSASFDIKTASEDGSTFEGMLACFYNVDGNGDILDDTAFDFKGDLASFNTKGVVRDEHMVTIGKIMGASVVKGMAEGGLAIKGDIFDTSHGIDVRKLIKGKAVQGLSLGSYIKARMWLDDLESVRAYWDSKGYTPTDQDISRAAYGVRLITRALPMEGSITFNPANERAGITSVKSDGQPAGQTFETHSQSVLAAVEEFLERAKDLDTKRKADGRALSPSHLARFRKLRDDLEGLLRVPQEPETKTASGPDATQLYAEFLHICAAQTVL